MGDISINKTQTPEIQPIYPQVQEPERIKHILIGSPKTVTTTMQVLQQLGYSDITDWSLLLETDNPGEVMSVLIREITKNSF